MEINKIDMKNIYRTTVGILSCMLLLLSSCESPEWGEPTEQDGGLLNFTVKIPGESGEYSATVKGPYEDGETIYIKVPTTEDDPVDVTGLIPYASLENNCYAEPAVPSQIDFTTPYTIKVRNSRGVYKTNHIEIVPTMPKTNFKKMWFKNSQELGINYPYISGIAVTGDYLLVHDASGGNANNAVKVYNRMTGDFVKEIKTPTTFTMQVKSDDAGHFVVNRYNIYGAGFMVYYYEDINSEPKLILNYTAADGCPVNLGNRMSVKGNLKTGKAYIYATTNGMHYYYWEFNDGVPVSSIPTAVRYANAGSDWTYASVKRKSIEEGSECYITYCHYDGNDSGDLKKGSRFEVFPPDMDYVQMNRENHYYKILEFDIFNIRGDEFTVFTHQPFWAWDGTYMRVFETTNRDNWSMVPGSDGYDQFMLMQSDMYGAINYNRWGDIATIVVGDEAYIYAASATSEATASGVMLYKMTYYPQ